MTVYWLVWDAAAEWIVDRLDREGRLPGVRRLRAGGVRAAGRPPSPNCQTPPSLATLFTGAPATEHGVTGFTVPGGDDEPVEAHRSGFGPRYPFRQPVWHRAHDLGLRTRFVHAPWVFDGDGKVPDEVDAAVEAYSTFRAGSDLLPLTGSAPWSWPSGDEPVDVVPTAAGVELRTRAGVHLLPPDGTWAPVRLEGTAGFWAARLDLPTGPTLARTGTWAPRSAGTDRELAGQLAGHEVFAGEGLKAEYRQGQLGARLVDGGDGSAEAVFSASLECVGRSFAAAARVALTGPRPALTVIYLPLTDDVGHEIAGWCDEDSAAYRPQAAPRLWEHVAAAYRLADGVLQDVLDTAGPHDTVILTADHGIVGSAGLVRVNQALIESGLARANGAGLDAAGSAVVYHPANNGLLRVNHDGRPGGRVPREQAGTVLAQAMTALGALEAGVPPRRIVTGFLDGEGRPLHPEGLTPRADTAYLVLHDDYQPTARVDGLGTVTPMPKSAAHVVNTGSDRLLATFAAAGPGLEPGTDLGPVDNTLAAQLVLSRLEPLNHGTGEAEPR